MDITQLRSGVVRAARTVLPARARRTARSALTAWRAEPTEPDTCTPEPPASSFEGYEQLYEAHARSLPRESSIGDGDFDQIGKLELTVLKMAGLKPDSTLLDFGCGTGRLAVQVIPYLTEGAYIGTDIAQTMLVHARGLTAPITGASSVQFLHQTTENFPVPDHSVDVICAFSVFTHMEHEDSYRYLQSAHRALRPGGIFVLSCLPIHLKAAKNVFELSASFDVESRWQEVRNVVTSVELLETISTMAGWDAVRWIDGAADPLPKPHTDETMGFGQSVLVLSPASS
ncbi:MAG: class I SAM-dependent methyltransferase [Actinobacteria bacterium]|nr:class I SAM-dependent methyltransferase [Actinomycetota bacterium]